jgi:hypothetical protein
VPIVLIIASFAMVGTVTASHTEQFSPFDEWVYYDYVTKIPTQFVVREGEFIGPAALQGMSCNGDSYGPRGQPCGGPYNNPAAYPQGGKTSADLYTPAYFAVTWVAAKAIQVVTHTDLLTAARLSGALWLAAGMWLFWLIMRKYRVNSIVTLGLGLAYIASPIAGFSYTYITTDAPGFLVGAALLLAAVRFIRGEGSGWWLVPIATLGTLLKVANLIAIGMIFIFLIVFAISRWRRSSPSNGTFSRTKALVVGSTMIATSLVAEIVWIAIRAALKVGNQPNQGLNGTLDTRALGNLIDVFFPGPLGFTAGPLNVPPFLSVPLGWLIVAGVIGFLFLTKRWGEERALSIAIATAVTIFGPLMLIGMHIVLGTVPPISGRYAAAAVPATLFAAAYITRNSIARWLVLAYGSLLFLTVLFYATRLIVLKA